MIFSGSCFHNCKEKFEMFMFETSLTTTGSKIHKHISECHEYAIELIIIANVITLQPFNGTIDRWTC